MSQGRPKYNRYDNIYELKQTLTKTYVLDKIFNRIRFRRMKLGSCIIYEDEVDFVTELLHRHLKIPIWKVMAPHLDDPEVGSVYYIAQDTDGISHTFRATYGYSGEGPHQSAFIEKVLEMFGLPIDVRDADFLLTFIGWYDDCEVVRGATPKHTCGECRYHTESDECSHPKFTLRWSPGKSIDSPACVFFAMKPRRRGG